MSRRYLAVLVALSVPLAVAAAPSPQAKAAFDRGEKALAAAQFEVAEQAYREAIAAEAGYAEALNGLGSALFRQGKAQEAVAQFRSAIAADASFKLAYFNLGYVSRKLSDFSTAAEAYEKYTALDANDPDGYYGLAESHRQLNNVPQAIAAYTAYIEKEKRPSEQKWVAKAQEALSQLEASTRSNASVDAGAPASPEVLTSAMDGGVQGAGPAAVPALAVAKLAQGDKLMQEKNYREASFAYQDAVNAAPTHVEALFKLGNAYAILGYYAQAIERWRRVAELATDAAVRASALENIAKAQAKIGAQGGDSPPAVGQAPGSGPVAESTRAQAREAYELGVKQIYARDYASAQASLSKAIQMEPGLVVAYVARGSAYIGLRRFAEAAADYQYALKLDGSLASPLYGLAESYRALGRVADARALYEQYAASNAPDARAELKTEAKLKADRLRP